MKVFMIGGTGFLGGYLVPKLIDNGHDLTLLTRDKQNADQYASKAKIIEGDLLKPAPFTRDLDKQDMVINIAMPPFKIGHVSRQKLKHLIAITTGYVSNAVMIAEKLDCPLVLTAGTSFQTKGDEVADESWKIARVGMAKAGINYDAIVDKVNEKGSPLIQMLPGQIYGPGGLFYRMIEMAMKGRNAVFGDGKNRIPRIFVDDCADAYAKVVDKVPVGEKYIIADDYSCTTLEFNTYLSEVLNQPAPRRLPKFLPRLIMGKLIYETLNMDCRVSNAKAKKELDWNPKHPTYKEGLRATIDALK
ncbi:NAD-dependent epimerase/dehydratase family protein [Bacteroidota bacterium]